MLYFEQNKIIAKAKFKQKGEIAWDMVWYQCTNCGAIIEMEYEVFSSDGVYAPVFCNKCGNNSCLCLYDNVDDIYKYYNPSLDERFFIYD